MQRKPNDTEYEIDAIANISEILHEICVDSREMERIFELCKLKAYVWNDKRVFVCNSSFGFGFFFLDGLLEFK